MNETGMFSARESSGMWRETMGRKPGTGGGFVHVKKRASTRQRQR
jgi:hypothetical protein